MTEACSYWKSARQLSHQGIPYQMMKYSLNPTYKNFKEECSKMLKNQSIAHTYSKFCNSPEVPQAKLKNILVRAPRKVMLTPK